MISFHCNFQTKVHNQSINAIKDVIDDFLDSRSDKIIASGPNTEE